MCREDIDKKQSREREVLSVSLYNLCSSGAADRMLSSSGVLLRRSCTAACAGNQRLLVGGPAGGLASLASASVRVPGGARAAGWKSASFGQAARAFSGYWPTADGAHGMHGTTILSVRRNGKVVVIGDGQISQGPTVVKGTAIKVSFV